MKIGVIGAGNVGGTLGKRWAQSGHEVMFGVRDTTDSKLNTLLAETGGKAILGTVAEAAAFGEVVVLSVPWDGAKDAIAQAGSLSGKILLDTINPVQSDLSGLAVGFNTSAAEQVSELAAGAKVVKIFNTTGANDNMANPNYGGTPLTMLYCGDDTEAKSVAAQLAADLGFSPVDVGPLKQARYLEPLAMLWISMAFGGFGRDFAFQIIKRSNEKLTEQN